MVVEWVLRGQVREQLDALRSGFNGLIPARAWRVFSTEEMSQLLNGVASVDCELLQESTVYRGEYSRDSAPIKLFWAYFEAASDARELGWWWCGGKGEIESTYRREEEWREGRKEARREWGSERASERKREQSHTHTPLNHPPPERAAIIKFTTGTPNLPLDGLEPPLTIVPSELGAGALPSSHACFNQLVLPQYASKEALAAKFTQALEMGGEGFQMS